MTLGKSASSVSKRDRSRRGPCHLPCRLELSIRPPAAGPGAPRRARRASTRARPDHGQSQTPRVHVLRCQGSPTSAVRGRKRVERTEGCCPARSAEWVAGIGREGIAGESVLEGAFARRRCLGRRASRKGRVERGRGGWARATGRRSRSGRGGCCGREPAHAAARPSPSSWERGEAVCSGRGVVRANRRSACSTRRFHRGSVGAL